MKKILILGLLAFAPALSTVAAAQQRPPQPPRAPAAPARGYLGISLLPSPQAEGTMEVEEVGEGTPADRAGLRVGDRIVRWNGRNDVMAALRSDRPAPGDTVRLRVAREGQRDFDLAIVAERDTRIVERRVGPNREEVIVIRPDRFARRFGIDGDSIAAHVDSLQSEIRVMLRDSLGPQLERIRERVANTRIEILRDTDALDEFREGLGLTLAGGRRGFAGAEMTDLNPGLGEYFGTDSGALVLRVMQDTPAADSGLEEGDVIVSANGNEIEDVRDLMETVGRERMSRRSGDDADRSVRLEVLRRGSRVGVTLER